MDRGLMHISKLPRVFQPFYCADLVRLGKDNDGGYLVNRLDVVRTQRLLSFGIGTDWSFEQDFVAINDCAVDSYDASVAGGDFFAGQRRHHQQNIAPDNLDIAGSGIFLKCDIEGAEYDLLPDIITNTKNFTGMAFEFHEINNPKNFDALVNFIGKVNQKLVHLHVNNYFYYINGTDCIPDILELTFSSADNIIYKPNLTLPHTLDQPNNPGNQEFRIIF